MQENKIGISISGNEEFKSYVDYILNEIKKMDIKIFAFVTVIAFLDKRQNYIENNNILICTNYLSDNNYFLPISSNKLCDKEFLQKCNSHHNIKEYSLFLGLNLLGCEKSISIVLDNNKSAPLIQWHRLNSHLASLKINFSDDDIKSQIATAFNLAKLKIYDFLYFSYN